MNNSIQDAARTIEKYAKEMPEAIKASYREIFDIVGQKAVRNFTTSGYADKKGYKTANTSSNLRIVSGDLTRSLIGGQDSIRKLKRVGNNIIGLIGSSVNVNNFYYPTYHELKGNGVGSGRFPFLTPAIKDSSSDIVKIVSKHINNMSLK